MPRSKSGREGSRSEGFVAKIENVFHARRYRVSIVASRENDGDGATSTNAHVFVVGIRASACNDQLSFCSLFVGCVEQEADPRKS